MASNLGARGGVFIDYLVFKKMLAGDASTRPNSFLQVRHSWEGKSEIKTHWFSM